MHHRDTEAQSVNEITSRVIGSAIEVHCALGPGLLESAYEECLCYELSQAGLRFERQVALPVVYKDVKLDCGYRMDIVVEGFVVLEIKAVDRLIPVHDAHLLTYLKLSDKPVGLIINFCVPVLINGIRRIAHKLSVSPRLCGESNAATIS